MSWVDIRNFDSLMNDYQKSGSDSTMMPGLATYLRKIIEQNDTIIKLMWERNRKNTNGVEMKLIEELRKLDGKMFWHVALDNKDSFTVVLDNDQTYLRMNDIDDEDGERLCIDAPCVGNQEGVFDLLIALGFDVEHC